MLWCSWLLLIFAVVCELQWFTTCHLHGGIVSKTSFGQMCRVRVWTIEESHQRISMNSQKTLLLNLSCEEEKVVYNHVMKNLCNAI